MRVTEIAVRRLKSFGDFSNIAVELRASVGPSDDLDMVFEVLLAKINEYIELAPQIEKVSVYAEELEAKRKQLLEEIEAFAKALDEYRNAIEELRELKEGIARELEEAKQLLSQAQSRRQSLLEKLKRLAR